MFKVPLRSRTHISMSMSRRRSKVGKIIGLKFHFWLQQPLIVIMHIINDKIVLVAYVFDPKCSLFSEHCAPIHDDYMLFPHMVICSRNVPQQHWRRSLRLWLGVIIFWNKVKFRSHEWMFNYPKIFVKDIQPWDPKVTQTILDPCAGVSSQVSTTFMVSLSVWVSVTNIWILPLLNG